MKTIIIAAALTCFSAVLVGADRAAKAKPVFLYSRYFNAIGENRYEPEGSYKEVLTRLREEFDVRVSNSPLGPATLNGVNVVLVANPSDKAAGTNPPPPHVTANDITALEAFVRNGGGLIISGNQENHNLDIEDMNKLLAKFGMQFTNLYTDIKKLVLPKETPVIGGLRWGYYTGNLVLITAGHSAKARPLIMNDLSQKPLNGPRDTPGALLAVAEPGRGRVVAVTDSGWIGNDALSEKGIGGVAVKGQDNWEIFRRLAHWAAGETVPSR